MRPTASNSDCRMLGKIAKVRQWNGRPSSSASRPPSSMRSSAPAAPRALNRPVLVIGERGTGKELIAERLHRLSPRWARAAGDAQLRGAARDADRGRAVRPRGGRVHRRHQARAGRFEEADGGTLFLDELATLSMARAGAAAARGRIWRGDADRRVAADARRRPDRRRDQRASAARWPSRGSSAPICSTG